MKDEIKIVKVTTKKQLKQFIRIPLEIYKTDPLWVPPLWILEKQDYRKGSNQVLNRSKHCLFLALWDEKPVGRILAYIDPHYNNFYSANMGFFGSFESIDDDNVSSALFMTAEKWLHLQGMSKIRGPINPVAESWGFLLEGQTEPVYMSPHNPLYCNKQIEKAGFIQAKDLLVYEANAGRGYKIPDRFLSFSEMILNKKPELSVRTINTKDLKTDAAHILRILNDSVAGNWGFVPVEKREMEEIVNKLKLILDKDAIWFVEDNGFPVGCALGFPDINKIFKKINGHLNPYSIFQLLFSRKKIKDYRLWGLAVLPKYQSLGLDVLLYVSLYKALEPKKIRLEANYMLDDNLKILNALEKMNLQQIKKYRVYEKELCE